MNVRGRRSISRLATICAHAEDGTDDSNGARRLSARYEPMLTEAERIAIAMLPKLPDRKAKPVTIRKFSWQ